MSIAGREMLIVVCALFLLVTAMENPSTAVAATAEKTTKGAAVGQADRFGKPQAAFDVSKMGDMSDFDPANPVVPDGDTIRIAIVASFSGPGTSNGQFYWACVQWAAHDINKRGGLLVDGKRKLVQVLKADHMGKPDQCKKVCERMVLQEKVHALWGTDGSYLMKVINEVANKYKVIALNATCTSDDIQNAANFGRFSFQASYSASQTGPGLAYYYGQIRKKERKFYILNVDTASGHALADSFKSGLKAYFTEGQVVGEDFHKLYLTDFAPYLAKIKASGAEVIFTGDWSPDAANLLKQSRQLGIKFPFANVWMTDPIMLGEVGVEGTKGLVHIDQFDMPAPFKTAPDYIKFYKAWSNQWKTKWKTAPYNSRGYELIGGAGGAFVMSTYWLLSVMERAKSTDAEKIVQLWEGDVYRYVNGKIVKMRGCDHKMITDLTVQEYVPPEQQKIAMTIPPFYWYKESSYTGPAHRISAAKILPWMDQKLGSCRGKNDWGDW